VGLNYLRYRVDVIKADENSKLLWAAGCPTVTRIFLPAVLLTVVFGGGTAARAQERNWELWGRVLRADTSAPISGAKVSYRGEGDIRDSRGRVLNPPTLHGEVTTGADGVYRITELSSGNYRIHAIAAGFLAGASIASAQPPASKCCPLTRSDDLKLQPDTIHLSTMNTEAFVQTHSQGLLRDNLTGIESSISPDGKLLALALPVLGSVPGEQTETWLYNWQHGVTALDLLTSRKRLTALPGDNPFYLMAEQRVPDGYLIAYWTDGDCNPADRDQPQPFATGGSQPAQVNVCFATIASPRTKVER